VFDEAVIVLAVGAAAGDLDTLEVLPQEGDQEMVHELGAVIEVELEWVEGEPVQGVLEGIEGNQSATAQEGHPLAPSGSHIHHLEGMGELS
jgi:hypothetical protein